MDRINMRNFLLIGCFFIHGYCEAKVIEITTKAKFQHLLNKYELVLVYFDNQYGNHADLQNSYDILQQTSQLPRYKMGGLVFLKVNVDKQNLCYVKQLFSISDQVVLLFKDGEILVAQDGSSARLEGQFSKAQLKKFIETFASTDLDYIIAKKEAHRKKRLQEELYWYNYYGCPYYGYTAPRYNDPWSGYSYPYYFSDTPTNCWGFGIGR